MRIGQKRLPLKALHAFEATARHLNMGQAAVELSVTQSAISHQVRNLEKELDCTLFDRSNRILALTPAGQRLFTVVADSLGDIKRCALSLDETELSGKFTIAATPAFTNMWLLPRIGELLEHFPDLELHFVSTPRQIAPVLPDADVVIQFGKHNWPRKRCEPVAVVDYMPYCSPRLLAQLDRAAPADLTKQVLIHEDEGQAWQQWLAMAGVDGLQAARNIYVNNAIDALELTRQGAGFSVNDQLITSHWLKEGHLIAPFRQVLESFESFYIVTSTKSLMSTAAVEFEAWLRQRIAESEW
jgi:LysR family glycine cleavage system transcriptional activator